jgi:Xaa-Pro dipeptidase
MDRTEKFQNSISSENIDYFLISSENNIYYLTGFYPTTDCYFLYDRGKFTLFVTGIDYETADRIVKGINIIKATEDKSVEDLFKNELKKLKGNLYFEYSKLAYKRFSEFFSNNKNLKFSNGDQILASLREVKDLQELNFIKNATRISEIGLKKAYEEISEDIMETEIAAEAEYIMRKNGAEGLSFDTLIITGNRTSSPHAKTGQNKLKKGDLIIIDLGCRFNGYCSDMTRTFVLGKPNEKQNEIYELVKESQERAINVVKAGLKVNELDSVARNFLKNKRYGEYFIHALGHGLGLEVHEKPLISYRYSNPLRKDSIITIEPGLYIPSWGGIRIEDMVLVREESAKVLTNLKKELTGL